MIELVARETILCFCPPLNSQQNIARILTSAITKCRGSPSPVFLWIFLLVFSSQLFHKLLNVLARLEKMYNAIWADIGYQLYLTIFCFRARFRVRCMTLVAGLPTPSLGVLVTYSLGRVVSFPARVISRRMPNNVISCSSSSKGELLA